MGWFDEQIRQRKKRDQEVFEDSFAHMAEAIVGSRTASAMMDQRFVTQSTADEILKYYHLKSRDIPESLTGFEDQLDFLLRPHGLMRRKIHLKSGWYREAFGPMIGFENQTHRPVAFLPFGVNNYAYTDPETGKRCRMTRKREKQFESDALCFYRPFPQKKMNILDLLKYIWSCFSIRDGILMISMLLIVRLLGLFLPLLSRAMLGPVKDSGDPQLLAAIALFLACMTVTSAMVSKVESVISERFSRKMNLQVDAASMMRVLSLPARFFRRYSSGEISSRMESLDGLCNTLMDTILNTSLTALFSLLYIGQIFLFAPSLVIPALLVILLTVVISSIATKMRISVSERQMEYEAKNSGLTFALINGIQKIRLAGAEKRSFARWAESYAKEAALEYNPPLFLKIQNVLVMAVGSIGTIYFYSQAVRSHMSMADYYAFTIAFGLIMDAFSNLAGIAFSVADIRPIFRMAQPLLQEAPEVSEEREVVTRLSGSIELNNVSFRYSEETPMILDDLSMKIRPGEYVAVVGTTGCGKSTLMRLLLGFEKPVKGAVYYDGKDLETLDPRSVRRKIGTVIQNGSLFQGDIYSNITICAPWLTMEEAWEAAEKAGIAEDIRNMPMGMQTMISEGQGGISGGQKQRLMIARAIAPKPRILMFDEATSALDNITQKQVSEALDAMKCTRIVIAHRLSTIRHCDRILVLDQGKIRESGTYEELMEANGFFADLVRRQTQ